jgi:hypothetical protein
VPLRAEILTTKDAKSTKKKLASAPKGAKEEEYFFVSFVRFVVEISCH